MELLDLEENIMELERINSLMFISCLSHNDDLISSETDFKNALEQLNVMYHGAVESLKDKFELLLEENKKNYKLCTQYTLFRDIIVS